MERVAPLTGFTILGVLAGFLLGWWAHNLSGPEPVAYIKTIHGVITLVDADAATGCLKPPQESEMCGPLLRAANVHAPAKGDVYTAHVVSVTDAGGGRESPLLVLIAGPNS
jgi:hypothetical protein